MIMYRFSVFGVLFSLRSGGDKPPPGVAGVVFHTGRCGDSPQCQWTTCADDVTSSGVGAPATVETFALAINIFLGPRAQLSKISFWAHKCEKIDERPQ